VFDIVTTRMNERVPRGSTAQLASGLLFGLAALFLALLSQSRPFIAVSGYALLVVTVGAGLFVTGQESVGSARGIHAWAAGDTTLALVGIASGIVFPGLVLAAGFGYFSWTPLAAGVGFSVAGLYAVYGAVAIGQWLRTHPV
jgi:hypothetical protein